ncbi:hypothetical protein ACVIVC_002009 [Sinorhizobium meliloti]
MVDPEPIDQAFPDEGEREPVGMREDRFIFDAHADEAGDLEKPSVAELVPGRLPAHQPPGLHSMQPVELQCVRGEPVETLVELGRDRRRRDDRGDFRVELCGGFPFGRAGDSRDPFERGIAVARDRRIAGGIERIESLVISKRQAAVLVVVCKAQIAGCDLFLKRLSEEGERERLPRVDVEIVGKFAKAAPFDHAVPPVILEMRGHVVRDDVQNETESFGPQRMSEPHKSIVAAQGRVDLVIVDDVVAMGRPTDRGEKGRGVEVRYAEPDEVRDQLHGFCEVHPVAELETVGCVGQMHGGLALVWR